MFSGSVAHELYFEYLRRLVRASIDLRELSDFVEYDAYKFIFTEPRLLSQNLLQHGMRASHRECPEC